MKRRLSGILAADLAGLSRLMKADEEATLATLNAQRQVDRWSGLGPSWPRALVGLLPADRTPPGAMTRLSKVRNPD